ncbi:MAG: type IX secretion system sortase PorU, partial [Bacteroidales bacterium]|nr:type IX secretion system sortase PorU [Bacteroidales bacterium]
MKKIPIFLILCFINNLLTSQIVSFSDSILWQNNKTYLNNDNILSDILFFKDAYNRSTDNLPVYYIKKAIESDAEILDIVLVKADYEIVEKENYQQVENVEKITEKPELISWISTFRKNNYLNFELIPLRKNPKSGELERIVYFECKIQYKTKPINKNGIKYSSSSMLSSNKWYKIKVDESGIYKISYSDLVEMGFSDFSSIGIFGYGGLLPKTAGQVVADDLPERPVYKVDVNSNSVFDSGDYLLFYADGPHNIAYNTSGSASHEFHNYSEYAYYFISDNGSFKQAQNVESLIDYDNNVTTYDDYIFLEKDSLNLMSSGRNLYWREFDYYLTHNFSMTIPDLSIGDSAKITVNLAAKSSLLSYFNLYINGVAQDQINISSVSGSSTDWYARTNSKRTFYIKPTSDDFTFSLTYNKTATNSKGWLDNISVQCRRNLIMENGSVSFRDTKSVGETINAKFNIAGASSQTVVWDITDRFNANRINGTFSDQKYSFIADASELKEYIAFIPSSNFPSPVYIGHADVGEVENQNLHALPFADLIIVAHPDFYSQGLAIKALHEDYDDMNVVITTPQKIYNEFSSGSPDVSAIRNFVKMFYDRAGSETEMPKNLLLLGDGSYDNLSQSSAVSNFILTYESDNSLAPTSSFVSDDFYVFLDDGEGSLSGAHNMDMGVGRIPVKTSDEAQAFVNKLQSYYTPDGYGNWKNNILLIADDAEGGETIHQTQTNTLGLIVETNHPIFNLEKLFLDDFEQISTVQGHRYPDVNQAINDYINNGMLVVNWIGHGNEKGWAHESVLTLSMIKTWKNKNKYPIFVTATCEFSPYDNHLLVSGGEEVLLNPDGGGIALFTTTRLAFASSNASLTNNFYQHLFSLAYDSKVNTIGLSAAYAKNDQGSDTNKRVFALLGDPAMRPSVPELKAYTTKINGEDIATFNDTLKAKELVVFDGVVKNPDGTLAEDFNGIIYPVVYDKRIDYSTRGNDGFEPLDYTAQKNIVFKGKA